MLHVVQGSYATDLSPAQVLQLGVPTSMAGVVSTVELLQEASLWFPGGSKEMRVRASIAYAHVFLGSLLCTKLLGQS